MGLGYPHCAGTGLPVFNGHPNRRSVDSVGPGLLLRLHDSFQASRLHSGATMKTADKPLKKRRRPFAWVNRYWYPNPVKTRTRTKKILGVPVRGLVSLLSQPSKKMVTVIRRPPRQKLMVRRMRTPKRWPSPLAIPFVRTQSYWRSVYRYYTNNTLLTVPLTSEVRLINISLTKTSTSLPKWREIIAAGGNATTAFSLTARTVDAMSYPMMQLTYRHRNNAFSPFELKQQFDSSFANQWYSGSIATHFSGVTDQKAQDRATQLLYKKIRQARQQLQGGVILGEIDKTAKLLLGTARGLKQGVWNYLSTAVGIRRGKGRPSAKRKAIANSYLQATFGWQPLINDCEDLAKTLGRLCYENDRVRFRVAAGSEVVTSQTFRQIQFASLFGNITTIEKTSTNVYYKGFLRSMPYEIGSPPLERIISMSGFDLRSFIPTMWELVPYSFLVDYFTNIGDCLAAFCTDTSIVKGLWRTSIKESTREYRVSMDEKASIANLKATLGTDLSGPIICTKKDGLITFSLRDVSRNVAEIPVMVPRLTGLDLPYRQFANIGALITGKSAR